MALVPSIKDNDWTSVRQAIQKISTIRLGSGSASTFADLTLTNLTASRLVYTDANKQLESITDLTNWVAGTANEIDITDDGDGTITIGIINPLIVAKGGTGAATLTDGGILLGSGTEAVTVLAQATNGQIPIGSTGADPVLATLTGTTNQITVTNAAGSITLSLPQDYHTGATPTLAGLTLSGLTQGSAIFAGAGGVLSEDNANLFWDDTNNRLGVGINSSFDPRTGVTISGDVDILHTATENDDHALELDVNAAGYGDVKALDIDYITGAISAGEDEGIILVNIDQTSASGGDIDGVDVLATEGSGVPRALRAGIGVTPIHHDSGSFANPTTGTDNTVSTDVAAMIDGSTGTTTAIFENNSEYILIGAAAAFQELEIVLTTGASAAGIKPKFEYSTAGSHTFTEFSPIDGTNGFRNTGVIAWDASDLSSHGINTDTGTYDIKITRQRTSLSTSPVLGYAKVAATTEYLWDKDGDVSIHDLTISTPSNIYALSHDSFADFVANEHIDHTAVTLTAGVGLSGGGDISANRTFTVDLNELTTETTIASGDFIAMVDITDSGSGKITFANFEGTLNHDSLTGFVSGEHFLQTAITNVSTALATGLLKVTTGTGALSVITDSSSNWNLAYTHIGESGASHTYINQNVTTTGTPSFSTINSLTLAAVAVGFTIAGGTTSKTLTVDDNFVVSTQLAAIAANTAKVTESTTVTAPLVLTTYDISIPVATTSANGYLSSTDWNTFNSKQAGDAGLTSLAGLVYASDSFIKVTATDTYAIRTIAETKTDLSLNLVENTAISSWAGSTNITTLGTISTVGNITIANGGTIGQAAGPLLTFDDTNNYLEITGCNVGLGTTTPGTKLEVYGSFVTNRFTNSAASNKQWDIGFGAGGTTFAISEVGIATRFYFAQGGNFGIRVVPINTMDVQGAVVIGAPYAGAETGPSQGLLVAGNTGIGIAAPTAKLHIDQSSTTAAIPVLTVDQADVSEEFIRFIGTSANGVLTQSIVDYNDVTTASLQGYFKIYVQDDGNQLTDQAYYIPIYTLA